MAPFSTRNTVFEGVMRLFLGQNGSWLETASCKCFLNPLGSEKQNGFSV